MGGIKPALLLLLGYAALFRNPLRSRAECRRSTHSSALPDLEEGGSFVDALSFRLRPLRPAVSNDILDFAGRLRRRAGGHLRFLFKL